MTEQMDFAPTEEMRELAALTRRLVTDRLTPQRLREVEQQAGGSRFDREFWQALVDAGVVAAAMPESLGGGGLDLLEQCAVLVELGRGVAPVPYLEHAVCTGAIGYFGTPAQRQRWGVSAAAGTLVLTAALAEEFGEAADRPATRAERTPSGWRLTGTKAVVPHATVADAFLVSASTGDGVTLFVVEPGDAGVSVRPEVLVDGDVAATLDLAAVELDDDRAVPGRDTAHWLVARTTIAVCAHQTGVLERALELTARYAREREQFGKPIGAFQAVAQRLADAFIDVEAVRLTMWEAAWRTASALPGSGPIAVAKFWAADAGHRVAHTAVHVHGGTGIDTEGETHRYFVAAKRNEFALGGATDQLRRLGRELADTPA